MKRIALMAVDSDHPNLALMKISAWHKAQGDVVEWYSAFENYDILYMSKIFNFTPDYMFAIPNAKEIVRGGTGYSLTEHLTFEQEITQPDYSIYPQIDKRTSYGFLTRGCPNKCKWCIVPKKEGKIYPYMDIDEITQNGARPNAILMDNNVLACKYGIEQIEKIADKGYRIDFNQGLDARLVTPEIAKLLARCKWLDRIRFGCDTPKQIEECERACELIDSNGYQGTYFFYCILMEFEESFARVNHWKQKNEMLGKYRYYPHAQPYRDVNELNKIPQWQKDLACWTDKKMFFYSCDFKDFEPRKGFRCERYLTYPASEDAKVDNVQALMNAWVCFDLLDGRQL